MQYLIPNLLAVIRQSGLLLLNLVPYVLAGALVSALLFKWRNSILPFNQLKLPIPGLIVCTAILGTISPLSTIGMVPVIIGLVESGSPIAAGLSFLTASSFVNPQLLLISFGTIGPLLTILQWLSGISIGCIAGFLVLLFDRYNIPFLNKSLQIPTRHIKKSHQKYAGFFSIFLGHLGHVLFYLVIGVLVAASFNVWLPESFIFTLFGEPDPVDVASGAVLSIPLYVCGGGVLPMMQVLLNKGLSPGIVLAFIIVGPATRFHALAAIGAFINKRALIVYIILILLWAVTAGVLYNAVI